MKTTNSARNSINQSPRCCGTIARLISLLALAVVCFTLSPQARAVCQEGCDLIHDNTFLGDDALINHTTGDHNTAIGRWALYSTTTGFANTAVGWLALSSNTDGTSNTAIG